MFDNSLFADFEPSPKGLMDPTAISMYHEDGGEVRGVQDGDNMRFDLYRVGTYTVSAGSRSLQVKVSSGDH